MLFRSDVYEEDGELVVEVEAPGVPPEKLEVSVDEGVLCIEAALPRRRRARALAPPRAPRRRVPPRDPAAGAIVVAPRRRLLRDGLLRVRLPLARRRQRRA